MALKGRSADPHPELPPLAGTREIPGGRGPSELGTVLLADPWIQQAIALLEARPVQGEAAVKMAKKKRKKKGADAQEGTQGSEPPA